MLPLDGLKVKDLESGLFTKHCFALFNPDSGRYVMKPGPSLVLILTSNLPLLRSYVANRRCLRCCVFILFPA